MYKTDIDFIEGSVNPGSIADELYVAFKRDIKAFPIISDDFATAVDVEDFTVDTGDFVMEPGKFFIKLYNTTGEGELSYETVGEADGKMFKNHLVFKYPKITDDIRAFAKYVVNSQVVFVVKHAGAFYRLGCKDYSAIVSTSGTSGKKAEDAHGVTVEAQAFDATALPRYIGNLPLSGGYIDCSTGDFYPSAVSPVLTVSTSPIIFTETVIGDSNVKTLNLQGSSLTKNINVSITGSPAFISDKSVVDYSDVMASGGLNLTLTYSPVSAGVDAAILRIYNDEGIDISIPLSGTASVPNVELSDRDVLLQTTVGTPVQKVVNIKGNALTGNLILSLMGDSEITIDQTVLTPSDVNVEGGANLTITYNPASVGNNLAVIYVTGASENYIYIPIVVNCVAS